MGPAIRGLAIRSICLPALLCLTVSGCNTEPPAPPHVAAQSERVEPPINGVTLDRLKPSWDVNYKLSEEPGTTKFEREIGSQKVVLEVKHDDKGNVSRITGLAIGPTDAVEERNEAFAAMTLDVLDALGMKGESNAKSYMDMGLLRARNYYAYNFRQDRINFFLSPDRKGTPGNSERVLSVLPVKSDRSGLPPIPNSSLEQLVSILPGFEVKAKIGDQEVLLVREQDSHKDVVHCFISDTGEIKRIEAFIADAKEGAPVKELRAALWLLIGDLEYEGSNPEEAKEFIAGKKLEYAAGDGRAVGCAIFYSQIDTLGERSVLGVWYSPPKR